MAAPRILSFVMAGGEGTRLRPFTEELPKPALPFGGSHRIVDFVLSNLRNSGLLRTYVLAQYHPGVLIEHIQQAWSVGSRSPEEFVIPLLPGDTPRRTPFRGTADAVSHCIDLIVRQAPDLVAVFAADHVYRMDVRQMVSFHLARDADVTVAAVEVPAGQAHGFGIIQAERDQRIRGFQEKPLNPASLPDKPGFAYASMGNYLFRPAALLKALMAASERGEHDFGQHVLPRIIHEQAVYAYNLTDNRVPGVTPQEETGYWRDVGNIESYVAAHREMLGPSPRFRLDNREWPIVGMAQSRHTESDSILGPASVSTGASLRNTVLQHGVTVEPGARIEGCIVMDGAKIRRGAQLRNAVIGPRSIVAPHARIGYDAEHDRLRFSVTPNGIVVVPPAHLAGRTTSLRIDYQAYRRDQQRPAPRIRAAARAMAARSLSAAQTQEDRT